MRIFEVLFTDGTERIMFGESRMQIRRKFGMGKVLKIEEIIICWRICVKNQKGFAEIAIYVVIFIICIIIISCANNSSDKLCREKGGQIITNTTKYGHGCIMPPGK